MRSVPNVIWLAGIASTWLFVNDVQAQFHDLVQYIPETANTMILVDAKAAMDSPIAKHENWRANRQERFAAGMTGIPPKANRLVIATHLDVEVMRPSWEVAVVEMDSQASLSSLADQFGGELDTVKSVPAVRLSDDSFVVQFADGLFGAMAPGNRQQVSHWVDRANRDLSPYLREGVVYADASAEVIMVLDLQHAFAAGNVERALEDFEAVKTSKLDKSELAKLIASARGIMLGITFRDQPYGKLKIDFGQDATLLSGSAKPLILEILGKYGVMVDEVADWKPEVKGSQVFLGGPLTVAGLSQLGSLIQLPTSALHTHVAASQAQQASTNQADLTQQPTELELTQQYFASVQRLLKHLKVKKRKRKTWGQLAQWCENYGRNVDRLPTMNVDKEMLQYGSYISSQLHSAGMSVKGMTIQRAVAENQAVNSTSIYGGALGNVAQNNWQSGGYYGGYGGNYGRRVETNALYGMAARRGPMGAFNSSLRQQQQARTAVRRQADAQGATSVLAFAQNIEQATNEICQTMTQKYQVQFTPAY